MLLTWKIYTIKNIELFKYHLNPFSLLGNIYSCTETAVTFCILYKFDQLIRKGKLIKYSDTFNYAFIIYLEFFFKFTFVESTYDNPDVTNKAIC